MPGILEQYSSLIETLYDAALDPQRWRELAPIFAAAFGSESCGMQTRDLASGVTEIFSITPNVSLESQAQYESHYGETDLWVAGASKKPLGSVVFGSEVTSESELVRSEYYNDWARGNEMFHLLGVVLEVESRYLGIVGVHRPAGARPFTDRDKHLLELVLPHLTRAIQLQRRLQGLCREHQLVLEATDALAIGLVVVDAGRRIIFSNSRTEHLLRQGAGLTVRHGCLRALNGARDEQLALLVRQATLAAVGASHDSGGVLALTGTGGRQLSLLVAPLRPEALPVGVAQPMALVFIGETDDARAIPIAVLAALYGLTPAEARLTSALLAGDHLDSYAAKTGISRETARSLLKRIFVKSGCSRQIDLIRTVLANPVLNAAVNHELARRKP